MPDFSLTLVLRLTTSKIINDVAKVQIKSEKITPFGGIFHVRELFSRFVAPIQDIKTRHQDIKTTRQFVLSNPSCCLVVLKTRLVVLLSQNVLLSEKKTGAP